MCDTRGGGGGPGSGTTLRQVVHTYTYIRSNNHILAEEATEIGPLNQRRWTAKKKEKGTAEIEMTKGQQMNRSIS
jgi:hypothetical protein